MSPSGAPFKVMSVIRLLIFPISIWVFRIVPAIWLCPRYGLVGYWIAMCFELNMRGALFLFYLARGRWLRLKSTAEL